MKFLQKTFADTNIYCIFAAQKRGIDLKGG